MLSSPSNQYKTKSARAPVDCCFTPGVSHRRRQSTLANARLRIKLEFLRLMGQRSPTKSCTFLIDPVVLEFADILQTSHGPSTRALSDGRV